MLLLLHLPYSRVYVSISIALPMALAS